MRARKYGMWHSPFEPSEVNFNYTEANSWQYSLYAPHAIGVLRKLIGGHDALESWLDRLFTTESQLEGRHQVDITGLIGQYAHGNEPSHHMAYLYNYTNAQKKLHFMWTKFLAKCTKMRLMDFPGMKIADKCLLGMYLVLWDSIKWLLVIPIMISGGL